MIYCIEYQNQNINVKISSTAEAEQFGLVRINSQPQKYYDIILSNNKRKTNKVVQA